MDGRLDTDRDPVLGASKGIFQSNPFCCFHFEYPCIDRDVLIDCDCRRSLVDGNQRGVRIDLDIVLVQ